MRIEWRLSTVVSAVVLVGLFVVLIGDRPVSAASADSLASPESFAGIADVNQRSAATVTELGKVLTSPRCTKCQPAGDRPRQGDSVRLHQPPVFRGPDGFGL